MIESGYFPIGEEYNPNAPYNQSNIEPIQLKVIISQSLSRPTTIEVTDYITNEWEDIEIDENGKFILYIFKGEEFILDQTLAVILPNYVKEELIATIKGEW